MLGNRIKNNGINYKKFKQSNIYLGSREIKWPRPIQT